MGELETIFNCVMACLLVLSILGVVLTPWWVLILTWIGLKAIVLLVAVFLL